FARANVRTTPHRRFAPTFGIVCAPASNSFARANVCRVGARLAPIVNLPALLAKANVRVARRDARAARLDGRGDIVRDGNSICRDSSRFLPNAKKFSARQRARARE